MRSRVIQGSGGGAKGLLCRWLAVFLFSLLLTASAQAQWPDASRDDLDGDGIDGASELARGTNPVEADSDGDGVWDGQDARPLDPEVSEDPYAIYLHGGPLVPSVGLDPALSGVSAISQAVLIQFYQAPTSQDLMALTQQLGVESIDSVQGTTYAATVPTLQLDNLFGLSGVRWVGAFPLASRMPPELWIDGVPEEARTLSDRARFDLGFSPKMSQAEIAALLASHGATEIELIGSFAAAEALLEDAQLLSLLLAESRLLFVELIGPEDAIQLDGIVARSNVGLDTLDASFNATAIFPYTGNDITVAVVEARTSEITHPELSSDSLLGNVHTSSGSPSVNRTREHATAVAGVITSDGLDDSASLGIAPDARVINYSHFWGRKGVGTVSDDGIDFFGALVFSQSYSAPHFLVKYGTYRNIDIEVDRYAWGGSFPGRPPVSYVWSAGNYAENTGDSACERIVINSLDPNFGTWDCIGGWSNGKNAITVGAVDGQCRSLTSFSSRGPTDDGRIKPEVVAPGLFVYAPSQTGGMGAFGDGVGWQILPDSGASCGSVLCLPHWSTPFCSGACSIDPSCSSNCCVDPDDVSVNNYAEFTGTSASTPVVTGILANALEAWSELGLEPDPRPATLKALLVQTAIDLLNDGSGSPASDGPNVSTGFGMVNAGAMLSHVESHAQKAIVIEDEVHAGGEIRSFKFSTQTEDQTSSMRVTVAWDDVPGQRNSTRTLQHDFDIRLIAPNGWVYHPWRVDGDNPGLDAVCTVDSGGSANAAQLGPCVERSGFVQPDRRNPIEQILVPKITPVLIGQWTLEVENIRYSASFEGDPVEEAHFSVVLPFDHGVSCGDTLTSARVLHDHVDCSSLTEGAAVTIVGDDVDLDCNGFEIIGPGGVPGSRVGVGVAVDAVANTVVENCEISGFASGIVADGSTSLALSHNKVHDNDAQISLEGVQTGSVQDNSLWAGHRYGLSIDPSSDGLIVSDNLLILNGAGGAPNSGAGLVVGLAVPEAAADRLQILDNEFFSNQIGIYNQAQEVGIDENRICFSGAQGLAQYGADTLVTRNVVCENGDFDIAGSLAWPSDSASDQNSCTVTKNYSDASVSSGCLNPCALCESGSTPPEVDTIGWDWFGMDQLNPELVIDVHDFGGSSGSGPSPLGSGIVVGVLPGQTLEGPNYVIRKSFTESEVSGLRRNSLWIGRWDDGSQQFIALPSAMVSLEGGGSVSAVVEEGGLYAVFGESCDLWINQSNAPQGLLHGLGLEEGDVVCLDPSQDYSNVALVLDTDEVVLDCQGASLSGSGTCIEVMSAEGARVESCQLSGCATGVRVVNSPGALITQNEFLGSGLAVELHASPQAELAVNVACEAGADPFQGDGSAILDGNVCHNSACQFGCPQVAASLPFGSEGSLGILVLLLVGTGVVARKRFRSSRLC